MIHNFPILSLTVLFSMPGIVHILHHELFASFGLSAIIQSKAINIETPLFLHHHGATLISNISKPTTPN